MSNGDQESWSRVKERLRAEVGDDVYSSWFARMDLEAIEEGSVRLSVPTRFLKSWIRRTAEHVLACWQAQEGKSPASKIVRSAVLKSAVLPKVKTDLAAGENGGRYTNGGNGRPLSIGDASMHEALAARPRPAPEL
jgi:chromosomal replication initiator protein